MPHVVTVTYYSMPEPKHFCNVHTSSTVDFSRNNDIFVYACNCAIHVCETCGYMHVICICTLLCFYTLRIFACTYAHMCDDHVHADALYVVVVYM